MGPMTMAFEDDIEEILDDPITINFKTGKNFLRESEVIDLDCAAEDSEIDIIDLTKKYQPDIIFEPYSPEQAQDFVRDIKPLNIKLIDCFKYPWYYKKYRSEIMRNKHLRLNKEQKSPTNKMDSEMPQEKYNKEKNENNKKYINEKEYMQHKLDTEIREAVKQRNKVKIDLKRNRGLIGMIVIEQNNNRDSKRTNKSKHSKMKNSSKHKHKESKCSDSKKSAKDNNNETHHDKSCSYVQSKPNITCTQIRPECSELNKLERQKQTLKVNIIEDKQIYLKTSPEDHTIRAHEIQQRNENTKTDNPNNEMVIRYYQNGKLVTKTVKYPGESKNNQKKQKKSNVCSESNGEVLQQSVAIVAPNVNRNTTSGSSVIINTSNEMNINNINTSSGSMTNNTSNDLNINNNINHNHIGQINGQNVTGVRPLLGCTRSNCNNNLEAHADDARRKQKTPTDKHQIQQQPAFIPSDFPYQGTLNNFPTMNYPDMTPKNNTVNGNIVNGVLSNSNEKHGADTQGLSQDQLKKFLLHVVAYDKASAPNDQRILYRHNNQNKPAPIVTSPNVNYPYMQQFQNYPMMHQGYSHGPQTKNQQNQVCNGPPTSVPQKNYTMQSTLSRQQKHYDNNLVPSTYTNISRSDGSFTPYPPPVYSQNTAQNFHQPVMQGIPRPYYPNYYRQRTHYDTPVFNGNPNQVRFNDLSTNRCWPGVYAARAPYSEHPNGTLIRAPIYVPQHQQLATPNCAPPAEDTSIIGRNDEGVIKKINIIAVPVGNMVGKKQNVKNCDTIETNLVLIKPSPVKSVEKKKETHDTESKNMESEETLEIQKAMQKKLDDLITNIFDMPSLTDDFEDENIKAKVSDAETKKAELKKSDPDIKKADEKTSNVKSIKNLARSDTEVKKVDTKNFDTEIKKVDTKITDMETKKVDTKITDTEIKKVEVKPPTSKPCPLSRKIKEQMVARYNKDNEMNNNNPDITPPTEPKPKKLETPKPFTIPNLAILKTRLFEENEILIDKKIAKKRYLFENDDRDKEPIKKISIEEYKKRSMGNNGNTKCTNKSNENHSVKCNLD